MVMKRNVGVWCNILQKVVSSSIATVQGISINAVDKQGKEII